VGVAVGLTGHFVHAKKLWAFLQAAAVVSRKVHIAVPRRNGVVMLGDLAVAK